MSFRGPVLIAFSACCIGVAGYAYQVEKGKGMSRSLARMADSFNCDSGAFNTSAGRVTCVTPVLFPFLKGLMKTKAF